MNSFYIFTYGTLRPGGALSGGMPGEHIGRASLAGATLHRHYAARFPVLCIDPDHDGDVTGDLFRVAWSDAAFIVEMELGAGYNATWHTVDTIDGPRQALAFTWPDDLPVGPYIWDGDWFGETAQRLNAELPVGAGFTTRDSRR